ncbi:MAG: hypothetical protein ABIJ34_05030 [archaeon]
MGKKERIAVEIGFIILNVMLVGMLGYLYIEGYIALEVVLASLFALILFDAFMLFNYYMHKKYKSLASEFGFEFLTRFMEQPRMEGTYKGNWFQLHFTSRDHGEYWGIPRTYIKLQYKDSKEFSREKLSIYTDYKHSGYLINSIEHVQRTYKNYLLMKIRYYVTDKTHLTELMDLLIKISKECEVKKHGKKSKLK